MNTKVPSPQKNHLSLCSLVLTYYLTYLKSWINEHYLGQKMGKNCILFSKINENWKFLKIKLNDNFLIIK